MDHGSQIKQVLCKVRRKLESKGNRVIRSYIEIGDSKITLVVTYKDVRDKEQEYMSVRTIRTSISDTLSYMLNTITI